jgi:death-on-curing protein
MIFVSVELVEALQKQMIERYSGSHGLRDRGLLESAVARAENTAYYTPEASVAFVAASLAWGLIKNRAFFTATSAPVTWRWSLFWN